MDRSSGNEDERPRNISCKKSSCVVKHSNVGTDLPVVLKVYPELA